MLKTLPLEGLCASSNTVESFKSVKILRRLVVYGLLNIRGLLLEGKIRTLYSLLNEKETSHFVTT